MFYKTLAAATMSLALATGVAMAQTSTEPGAVQADGQTPAVSGETQGEGVSKMTFTSDNERMMVERNMSFLGGFFTDDTMATLRPTEEMSASFSSLTPEQQQALRSDCTNVTGDTSNSYGQSVVDLCTSVGAM